MTQKKSIISRADVKQALQPDGDFLRPLIERIVQEVLEVEMEQSLQAGKSERTTARLGSMPVILVGADGQDFIADLSVS